MTGFGDERVVEAGACPIDPGTLGDGVRRHAGPEAKTQLKMMAARGLAPLPPRDLVTALFINTFDPDPAIAGAAESSLSNLDPRLANAVLSDPEVSPHVLGHLARVLATHDSYVEKLLLNRSTPTAVFLDVALVCSEPIADLIANNQDRLLQYPDIVRGLVQNPNVPQSTRDRVVDFLVRSGRFVEGLPQFEDAYFRLRGEDRLKAADNVEIPVELLDERCMTDEQREARKLIDDEEGEEGEEDPLDKLPIEERLRRLPLPALIAFATKGNKTVRKTLLRHTNRIVALAAVTSPMIQEPEILEATQSKMTHQDAVNHIATDKKSNWTRIYAVKLALVTNPKTQFKEAMKLLPFLNQRDLKKVCQSRNVPLGVRNHACKLSQRR